MATENHAWVLDCPRCHKATLDKKHSAYPDVSKCSCGLFILAQHYEDERIAEAIQETKDRGLFRG